MSCCCAGGFTPCSGVSKYVGVSYKSNNWSALTGEYTGITKEAITNVFPNFCHDIKSYPKDASSDYVAIAGGDYGCRLITVDNKKQWSDVELIQGSSSSVGSDQWTTGMIFGFLPSEFNIGDRYGSRYGWDGFRGVYGIDFLKFSGKTFLLLVCGKNGIDLYNIDDQNYIFQGLKADTTTVYKKVLYNGGKIFVGTAGYNRPNMPSVASFENPEVNASVPSPISNKGVLAYKLNLEEDATTGNITGSLTNLKSSNLSFGKGGVNDIIFNKIDKKIYFSYSHHEDNRKTVVNKSRADRLNQASGYLWGSDPLVLSGGVKRFDPVGNEDAMGVFTGFTIEDYHDDPVGQLSQTFDGSIIGARLKIDRVIPHFEKSRSAWPISHLATKYNDNTGIGWFSDYFENIYTHCMNTNLGNGNVPDCVEPCYSELGCSSSIPNPRCGLNKYTTIHFVDIENPIPIRQSDFSSRPVKELNECFFGQPRIDEINPNPPNMAEINDYQSKFVSIRRNHFGNGITGISVCSSGEDKNDPKNPRPDSEIIQFSFVLSHWQTGFTIIDVYKDWSYKERQQVSSMDIQPHVGGTYNLDWPYENNPNSTNIVYTLHHKLHRNFPSSISCGRSTSTRFGPVISVTVENIFGDMGPLHYGLHTIHTPSQHCQQLMFNHSDDFNRLRGIII